MGQQVPGTAGAEHVEDRVEDFADVRLAGPASARRRGQQGPDDLPLGIGQVGLVGVRDWVVGVRGGRCGLWARGMEQRWEGISKFE